MPHYCDAHFLGSFLRTQTYAWQLAVHKSTDQLQNFKAFFLGSSGNKFWNVRNLFGDYASQCQGQPRDKQGQGRDKQGQAGTFPFCPCLSLLVPVCPCLSLLVLVCPCMSLYVLICPCLSLYVSTFAIPSCLPLQMNITVFISMNIVTLTFLAKGTVPKYANLVFNFFFAFHLASSITLSFNTNISILVINITEGSTWFQSSFFLHYKLM